MTISHAILESVGGEQYVGSRQPTANYQCAHTPMDICLVDVATYRVEFLLGRSA